MNGENKAWGRGATFALAVFAVLAGQFTALLALTFWYGQTLGHLPNFSGDGAAITLIIAVSTPVEVALLALFATRAGANAVQYLGLTWPKRGELLFGLAATVAMIVAGNVLSWLLGRNLVTPFQTNILHHRKHGRLVAVAVDRRRHPDADRRGGPVSRFSVPRLAARAARRLAGDRCDIAAVGRSFICNTTGTSSRRYSCLVCCSAGCAGQAARPF